MIPWLVSIGIVFGVAAISFSVHRYIVAEAVEEGRPIVEERQAQRDAEVASSERADTLQNLYDVLLERLEERPLDSMMVVSAANVAYDLGRYEDAERFYRRFLENIDNTNSAIRIDMSFTVFQQGRQDEALGIIQNVIDADPVNQTALFNMAYMSDQMGNADEALEWMEKCRDAGPETALGRQAGNILNAREIE